MRQIRKDMPEELRTLQERLRALLRANMGEARRTKELLRDTELKMEEQLGHFDSIETAWFIAGKKFRKEPIQDTAPRARRSPGVRSASEVVRTSAGSNARRLPVGDTAG